MIKNLKRAADAIAIQGMSNLAFFRKNSLPLAVAGGWQDGSVGAGLPKYNAYVGQPLTATPLIGSGNNGIYLGEDAPSGMDKYINVIQILSSSSLAYPSYWVLMDYLMFYPSVDGDDTDIQDMDNTQTLPRYISGEGVQCMIVCTTPMVQDAIITVTYTNSSGVSGRVSTSNLVFSATAGVICSSGDSSAGAGRRSAFIPYANGDVGMDSIQSVQLSTPLGGFFALVLVKPITQWQLLENTTATEIIYAIHRGAAFPKIKNGAYLNMIYNQTLAGSAAPISGFIEYFTQ
jgi:hypothetical protein